MANLLELNKVSKVFRIGSVLSRVKLTAVDDVSFSLPADEPIILSVVGESGCGKSTICKMILQMEQTTEGEIVLEGKSYKSIKRNKEFYNKVQPIFQNPFEAFSTRKPVDSYLFNTALRLGIAKNKAEATERVDEALKSVGLSLALVKGKYSSQFSGGELARVSIARALITKPKIIIADEPVSMIDASMKMNIVNLFKEIRDKHKVSFIYVTHDLSTAYYVSDYIATFYRGSMIEYGTAKEIMDDTAHPYTKLLMDSIPRVGDKWEQDIAMSDIEEKEYAITYCKFAPRCAYATEECMKEKPPYKDLGGGRKVMCFNPINQ